MSSQCLSVSVLLLLYRRAGTPFVDPNPVMIERLVRVVLTQKDDTIILIVHELDRNSSMPNDRDQELVSRTVIVCVCVCVCV